MAHWVRTRVNAQTLYLRLQSGYRRLCMYNHHLQDALASTMASSNGLYQETSSWLRAEKMLHKKYENWSPGHIKSSTQLPLSNQSHWTEVAVRLLYLKRDVMKRQIHREIMMSRIVDKIVNVHRPDSTHTESNADWKSVLKLNPTQWWGAAAVWNRICTSCMSCVQLEDCPWTLLHDPHT